MYRKQGKKDPVELLRKPFHYKENSSNCSTVFSVCERARVCVVSEVSGNGPCVRLLTVG